MRVVILAAIVIAGVVGCGPMLMPMTVKLDAKEQERYDRFWQQAVRPADRLTRQELLDAIMASMAFQLGVDRVSFRSEKRVSGGVVVMEAHCDRFAPEQDRFDISMFDRDGKCVRAEHYTRTDVEQTLAAFTGLDAKAPTTQEAEKQRVEHEARYGRLHELFPEMFPEKNGRK